jgi:uncharacterized protein (TIGR00251 family)
VIRETATGTVIEIKVIPRARRSELGGVRDARLVVRLAAPPVDGAANLALIEFLADLFQCPRRSVRLLAGETSRTKRVEIQGLTVQQVEARLAQ